MIKYFYKDGHRLYWTITMYPSSTVEEEGYIDTIWRYNVRRDPVEFKYDGECLWDGEIRGQGETPPAQKDVVSDMLSNFSITCVHSIGYWSKVP